MDRKSSRLRRLRRRTFAVLGGTALVSAIALGFNAMAPAQAAAPQPASSQPQALTQPSASCAIPATVQLHGHSYHVLNYGRFGITPQKGHQIPANEPAVAKCKAGGITPAADQLIYHGGPLEISPQIYLDFWGSQWNSDGNGVESYMQNLFKGLGTSSDSWSTITSQYADGSGNHPTFNGTMLHGVWVDNSSASPQAASASQLAAEAAAAAGHFGVSGPNVDVIVLSPSGTNPDGWRTGGYCAYHTWNGTTAWTNEPYVLDVGGTCGANTVRSQLDGFSITAGHEYAEAITDPEPASGYIDSSGEEIGDLCAWQNLTALNLGTGTFAMQPLYSNSAGACALNGGSSGGGGGGTSEYVSAASGRCLDDPNASTTPGTIVEIWDCHHGQNQEWTYTSSKQLTVLGKCLDVTGQGTTAGTRVEIWTCNGQANQQWNIDSNGTITGVQSGLCLDVRGGGDSANGTQIDIWTCNGGTNQKWTTA